MRMFEELAERIVEAKAYVDDYSMEADDVIYTLEDNPKEILDEIDEMLANVEVEDAVDLSYLNTLKFIRKDLLELIY